MLKLYKKTPDGFQYWEAWDDGDKVIVHWGALGNTGESLEIPLGPGEAAEALIKTESRPHQANGFKEIEPTAEIVVQYKCDGWGGPLDLDKRYRVEGLMNECLGWTGNGHCDGGDIGSGTINVFSLAIDADIAAKTTINCLRENQLLEGAIISTRKNIDDEDEQYQVHWPADFSDDEFSPV